MDLFEKLIHFIDIHFAQYVNRREPHVCRLAINSKILNLNIKSFTKTYPYFDGRGLLCTRIGPLWGSILSFGTFL